jgi:hypothetical protein
MDSKTFRSGKPNNGCVQRLGISLRSRFSNPWRQHSFRTALHELLPAENADRDSRTGLMAEEEDTAP